MTPAYIYDTQLLQATLDALRAETAQQPLYNVHYAIKANANPILLSLIRKAGLGIDCVSGGEVQAAINAGFNPKSIVFAGVAKSDWEINLALQHDIYCFNVESIPELEVIDQLAANMGKTTDICLRINPDVGAHTHANITTGMAENKFGIAMHDMMDVIRLIGRLQHIRLRGLHFHIGSQILEMGDFAALARRINELQDQLQAQGILLSDINVGGGLGIDYQQPSLHPIPDFHAYFQTYQQLLQQRDGQRIHFELGRAIVAQCGTLLARVLYIKKATQKQFAIVDAGMTELIRPALYQAHHHIDNITATGNLRLTDTPTTPTDDRPIETYDVVGPICESSDVFDTDIQLPQTRRGDIIAIRSAGAYGETMASQYNLRPLPPSYTVEEWLNQQQ